jgi:ABC-type sulfate transport system permease subunit
LRCCIWRCALGEIAAVAVVSSNVAGSTLTLPLLVQQRESQITGAQQVTGAYAAATELATISVMVLIVMTLLAPRRDDGR